MTGETYYLKPFVWMKKSERPVFCQICLSELLDGDSALFYTKTGQTINGEGDASGGKKNWVHYACWKNQKREAEEHDRSIGLSEGMGRATSGAPGETGAEGTGCRDSVVGEALEELQNLTAQLYDIEAHVGSALAAARVLAAKVNRDG